MIIVDTGAFLALFNQRDTCHYQAQMAFNNISEPLISTYPVVTKEGNREQGTGNREQGTDKKHSFAPV
jgi:predicted nucleic acid-binding protein